MTFACYWSFSAAFDLKSSFLPGMFFLEALGPYRSWVFSSVPEIHPQPWPLPWALSLIPFILNDRRPESTDPFYLYHLALALNHSASFTAKRSSFGE